LRCRPPENNLSGTNDKVVSNNCGRMFNNKPEMIKRINLFMPPIII